MTVKITENAGKLTLDAPYHPDFAGRAKKLGGKWNPGSKTWTFDARDEERVRALCKSLYGTDGSPETAADVLTIRASAQVCEDRDTSYWLGGRQVARVTGRDSGARLGDGVVVLRGGFDSGGSMKNYRITRKVGTVVEVRDVPRAMAEKVHAEFYEVTLLDAAGNIVREPTHDVSVEAEPTALELVENNIAHTEGRLFGLRFRANELRAEAA